MKSNNYSFAVTVFLSIILLSTPITMTDTFAQQSESKIPTWVKNNADWWADGLIDESTFTQGLEYLIKEEIMQIPPTTQGSAGGTNEIPTWVKNNAGWWADGSIDDSSFVQGIQFLVNDGIIQVSSTQDSVSPKDTQQILTIPQDSVVQEKNNSPSSSSTSNSVSQNNNLVQDTTINTEKKLLPLEATAAVQKSLLDKVQNNGKVRVIIELEGDFKPSLSEQQAASDAESAAQQAASDAESAAQQVASDAKSAAQQAASDAKSAKIKTAQNSLMSTLSSDGIISSHSFKYTPYMAMTVNQASLEQLISSKLIKSIQEDRMNSLHLDETLPIIQADDVFAAGFDGTGQTVAILDTGINKNHIMFAGGKVVSEACYASDISEPFAADSWICAGDTLTEDESVNSARPCTVDNHATIFPGCDHGTHVAGIAAGNNAGVSGPSSGVAKGANIIAIQVFTILKGTDDIDGPDGDIDHLCHGGTPESPVFCLAAFDSDIKKGLERVLELHLDGGFTHDISSVNLSLGSPAVFVSTCDKILINNILVDNPLTTPAHPPRSSEWWEACRATPAPDRSPDRPMSRCSDWPDFQGPPRPGCRWARRSLPRV